LAITGNSIVSFVVSIAVVVVVIVGGGGCGVDET